jgi:hypothetical protein
MIESPKRIKATNRFTMVWSISKASTTANPTPTETAFGKPASNTPFSASPFADQNL